VEARGKQATGHDPPAAAPGRAPVRRMALSLGLTAALMLTEALGGWLSGSLALLSDAGHMLTDAASLALALLAMIFGARPADPRRTFGFRRAEVLAAQINAGALAALSGWIGWEAVDRLRHPAGEIRLGLELHGSDVFRPAETECVPLDEQFGHNPLAQARAEAQDRCEREPDADHCEKGPKDP